jgi:TM2 domain-containing membrane protein YozV
MRSPNAKLLKTRKIIRNVASQGYSAVSRKMSVYIKNKVAKFELINEEHLVAKSNADRLTDAGGVQGGTLYLTNQRIAFCATPGVSHTIGGAFAAKVYDQIEIKFEGQLGEIEVRQWGPWKMLFVRGSNTKVAVPKTILRVLDPNLVVNDNDTGVGGNKRIAAGICGILFGSFGIHKFILGYTAQGVITLAISLLGGAISGGALSVIMSIIGLIEGIKYLCTQSEKFEQEYFTGKRGWF